MAIVGFQHINTRSTDVERTRAFYERVLGLRVGDRPPLASTGYWLYAGDEPIVHLIQRPDGEPDDAGHGNFDHVAFSCADLEGIRNALRLAGVPFRETVSPRDGAIQLRVQDPDGINLELNFDAVHPV
jgi:catechol 2,3-dioxygenase-like lactoylglutathione lyase family enzyme